MNLTIITRPQLREMLGTTDTTICKWERIGLIRRLAPVAPGQRNGLVRYVLEDVIQDLEKAGSISGRRRA